ncbi:hypothetical protein H6G89_19875 [Oscillatoria sp. FACHB-1407]|uniref:hypothetical protein n=1 Tax=Oscillatoria sp. FACHB-1407 TaxID=2692847 RepID=UPI001687395A|nr:hypothetical protein [Oscillatoria sp. FACHB-1407]MBD2463298.1 hypothetical protein [Oscillatoria sp. FACHB-1407]
MSIQKFSLATIEKVRQYIRKTLLLPDSEQQPQPSYDMSVDELPEPESLDDLSGLFTFGGVADADVGTPQVRDQWFVSTVNPAAALLKLPGLSLKSGFRLVSYLYRSEGSGVGVVWAVPEELSSTAQLEKALVSSTSLSQIPKPVGALSNFMEVIEGDRSPVSFIIASIFRRELQEFGALGQRCNWSHHQLVNAPPSEFKWQWRNAPPKDLAPKVKLLDNGQAAVEFFTCCDQPSLVLYRHIDQYPAHHYKPQSLDQSVATAPD